jgi:hypothetical protein
MTKATAKIAILDLLGSNSRQRNSLLIEIRYTLGGHVLGLVAQLWCADIPK